MAEETGASLSRFGMTVPATDIENLLARLRNPRITHRLGQIGAGGPAKLPQRLLAPAAELIESTVRPRLICLALAGWIRHLQTGDGEPDDPRTGRLRGAVAATGDPARAVDAVLGAWAEVPGTLRESPVFRALLTGALDELTRDGVPATLRRAVKG